MGLPLLVKVFAAGIGMAMMIGAETAAAAALNASVCAPFGTSATSPAFTAALATSSSAYQV